MSERLKRDPKSWRSRIRMSGVPNYYVVEGRDFDANAYERVICSQLDRSEFYIIHSDELYEDQSGKNAIIRAISDFDDLGGAAFLGGDGLMRNIFFILDKDVSMPGAPSIPQNRHVFILPYYNIETMLVETARWSRLLADIQNCSEAEVEKNGYIGKNEIDKKYFPWVAFCIYLTEKEGLRHCANFGCSYPIYFDQNSGRFCRKSTRRLYRELFTSNSSLSPRGFFRQKRVFAKMFKKSYIQKPGQYCNGRWYIIELAHVANELGSRMGKKHKINRETVAVSLRSSLNVSHRDWSPFRAWVKETARHCKTNSGS